MEVRLYDKGILPSSPRRQNKEIHTKKSIVTMFYGITFLCIYLGLSITLNINIGFRTLIYIMSAATVNSHESGIMERTEDITQMLGNEPLERWEVAALKVLSPTFTPAAGTLWLLSDELLCTIVTDDHRSSHIPVSGTWVMNERRSCTAMQMREMQAPWQGNMQSKQNTWLKYFWM